MRARLAGHPPNGSATGATTLGPPRGRRGPPRAAAGRRGLLAYSGRRMTWNSGACSAG